MSKAEFVARFGDVFEHSPWIASRVWDAGLDRRHDTATGLHQAFEQVIRSAEYERQLELLCAHPQLAVGIAAAQELTASSRAEQRGAGLDLCTPGEYAEFQRLNQDYLDRFHFPFIMAVSGHDRQGILESFRMRLMHDADQEFASALNEVIRIGELRINQKFEQGE